MTQLINAVNEYGTPVTAMTCTACGHEFTVCPPVDPDEWGRECIGDTCPSYDISRDIDIWFEPAVEAGLIQRERLQ